MNCFEVGERLDTDTMASTGDDASAGGNDFDTSHLTPQQQGSLEQYVQVTNQEAKDAVALLERSQWNVQVRLPLLLSAIQNAGSEPI